MARVGKLQGWIDRARKHWAVILFAGVVAVAAGYDTLSDFVGRVWEQLTPSPVPEVIQLEQVPVESEAYSSIRTRWMVTVSNPSKEPLAITRARYRVSLLNNPSHYANAVELTGPVYRLPLDCNSGSGSRPLVPPFQVQPGGFATFVIDGGDKDLECLFRLSFETTQGTTEEKLAEAY